MRDLRHRLSHPDGTCIRDYIHILDLAQAHILGLAPGRQGFYNLGNGDGYSVREVVRMCEKVTGKTIPAMEKPRRPGDPPRLVASAERAMRELGWKPKYPKLERHRRHRLGLAQAASQRLRGLSGANPPTAAE